MADTEHEPTEQDVEVLREAVTMALYISLSLLAVFVALPAGTLRDSTSVAATVGITAVALVLAHQFAFRLSTRLVHHGVLDAHSRRLLGAQMSGGAAVTAVAVVPVLLFGASAINWTIAALVGFVAVVGYLAARSVPVSRLRALGYVALVVLGAVAVLIVKGFVSH